MTRNIYMPMDRFLAALKRIRNLIADGIPLTLVDDTTIGAKHSAASWGVCSDQKQAWPDAQDHLWPDQFIAHERVAPLYRTKNQHCPFDDPARRSDYNKEDPSGCFYRCKLFSPTRKDRSKENKITREKALALYDAKIQEADLNVTRP